MSTTSTTERSYCFLEYRIIKIKHNSLVSSRWFGTCIGFRASTSSMVSISRFVGDRLPSSMSSKLTLTASGPLPALLPSVTVGMLAV